MTLDCGHGDLPLRDGIGQWVWLPVEVGDDDEGDEGAAVVVVDRPATRWLGRTPPPPPWRPGWRPRL